jgi:hypothetical protein
MSAVDRLFEDAAFAPDVTRIMREAFEMACRSLHDTGQPEIVREVLARRIVELTRQGERDPKKLCQDAMRALGMESTCE